MKQFISTIKLAMWMMLFSFSLIACTEDDLVTGNTNNEGTPIQLVVSGPEDGLSRALKEAFENGDGIHIQTVFTLDGNQTTTIYSFLKLENGTWKDKTGNFNWPWNAVSAKFTAYHTPGVEGYSNQNSLGKDPITLSLSDLSVADNDPLMATYTTDVKAGSSVYLQFAHSLSKVTFINLNEDGVTDGEELRLTIEGAYDNWSIQKNDKNELVTATSTTNDYIANTVKNDHTVTFLIPETAKGAKLKLSTKYMNTLHAFNLPESLENGFEIGKHYTIDVATLYDNFLSDDIKEDLWNTDEEIILSVEEIGDYLNGVSNGKKFSVKRTVDGAEKEIPILITYIEQNAGSEDKHIVSQIRDVNFANQEFTTPTTAVEVKSTVTFYGNNHYIKNVYLKNIQQYSGETYKSIFAVNKGEMKDLKIENVKTENSSATTEKYLGILIGRNEGELSNIRIKGDSKLVAGPNAQYIGSLTGWNNKKLTNCSVKGTLTISAVHGNNAVINVGGLVGYTTSVDGDLNACQIEVDKDNSAINLSGTSASTAFIGGLAGQNITEASIENCQTNLPVNIEKATSVYAGGFIGMASANIKQCTYTGSLNCTAGTIEAENALIGGFVGSQRVGNIENSATIGSVTGTFGTDAKAGGFVGRIYAESANTNIQYSSATGTVSNNVAGMAGSIETKDSYKATIDNSFCLKGTSFTKTTSIDGIVTSCHIKGINPVDNNNFTPNGSDKNWTIDPPIYGAGVYYLKR